MKMRILGIETSCDETAAAVIEGKKNAPSVTLLSNIVSSSVKLHEKTGGIIPENAAREQLKFILPVIDEALRVSYTKPEELDAIALTYGPGLIGSLLVGVETVKTLSYIWNKPIIPINHLIGHLYANWIQCHPEFISGSRFGNEKIADQVRNDKKIEFPAIGLIVSGGHTDLVLIKQHGNIVWLGGTRDDAAGEALDKIGRLLGLPYPAGPTIEQRAQKGNPKRYHFPRPMMGSNDFNFSFSGLKTAAYRQIQTIEQLNNETIADFCASIQQAIVDVLIKKTLSATKKFKVKSILLGGGVAANQKLRNELKLNAKRYTPDAQIFVPTKSLCTDNAAMIAAAAFFNYKPVDLFKVTADPELYFN